ncbi:MAG: ATP-binding cassette domain-containing protein [Muribaculaceae bacterium]|nr:ATP-binding cassette domain-containing protein [Muribaculaceae bacterium]
MKGKQKLTLIALLFAVILGFVGTPLEVYAAEATVTFGSNWYDKKSGETFPVGVYLKAKEAIGDYHIEIQYDTLRLSYVKGADETDEENGILILEGNQNAKEIKFWLQFKAISGGEASIEVSSAEVLLRNSAENEAFTIAAYSSAPVHIQGEDTAAQIEERLAQEAEEAAREEEEARRAEGETRRAEEAAARGAEEAAGAEGTADTEGTVGAGESASVEETAGAEGTDEEMARGGETVGNVGASQEAGGRQNLSSETDGRRQRKTIFFNVYFVFVLAVIFLIIIVEVIVWSIIKRVRTRHKRKKQKQEKKQQKKQKRQEKKNQKKQKREEKKQQKKKRNRRNKQDRTQQRKQSNYAYPQQSNRSHMLDFIDLDIEGQTAKLEVLTVNAILNEMKKQDTAEIPVTSEDELEWQLGRPVIKVSDVTMEFKLYSVNPSGLKEYAVQLLKREVSYRRLYALYHVSFNVYKGEVIGIIGTNGSGKSTLLKIISGALKPTSGHVEIVGRRKVQLLTIGTGFDVELTAKENVFLNGSIIGYSKKFLETHYDEIVEFAELQDFMDEKVKNFSSGMVSRLGFAIATAGQAAEILILDEILSVGDEFFRQKSLKRIKEMIHGGSTVLMVSHSMGTIMEHCSRCVWIEKGELRMVGEPKVVCEEYRRMNG